MHACAFFRSFSEQFLLECCFRMTCLDGWDDDPNTKEPCDHHLIAGRQSGHQVDKSDVSFNTTQIGKSGAHNYGVGGCLNPYGNQICKCSASRKCEIDTTYPFSWVDIRSTGTKITKWIQNKDDGWFHVNLPWGFPWFGKVEHKITIGTNGVITFGKNQLHNGATEPVPCAWEAGKAIQGGKKVRGCVGKLSLFVASVSCSSYATLLPFSYRLSSCRKQLWQFWHSEWCPA